MAELPPIEALALPFTFGMALGLSVGRVALGSTLVGVALGAVLFALLVGVRQLLVS